MSDWPGELLPAVQAAWWACVCSTPTLTTQPLQTFVLEPDVLKVSSYRPAAHRKESVFIFIPFLQRTYLTQGGKNAMKYQCWEDLKAVDCFLFVLKFLIFILNCNLREAFGFRSDLFQISGENNEHFPLVTIYNNFNFSPQNQRKHTVWFWAKFVRSHLCWKPRSSQGPVGEAYHWLL